MKKILLTSAVLASTFAVNAHASQARLLALGMTETDNEGSYYISDERSVFLNPAYMTQHSNHMVMEWGNAGKQMSVLSTTSDATLNDNTSTPKAMGGFFKKYGDFNYGVYLGNESNTSSLLRIAGTSALSTMNGLSNTPSATVAPTGVESKMLPTADNVVDLFFGGDNGLKWGTNLSLAFAKNDNRSAKESSAAIRTGVIGQGWDAHLNLSLVSKSKSTDTMSFTAGALSALNGTVVSQEFKGKFGAQLGGSYNLPVGKVFGYVKHYGWEQTDSTSSAIISSISTNFGGQNGTVKGDFTSYYAGWGHEMAVNNGDKVFTSLTVKKTDINLKFTNKSEVRHLVIPVSIGYEAKATEWLTLRGSIIQNIWGQYDNKNINNYSSTGTRLNKVASGTIAGIYGGSGKATVANSTTVNAGATLTFGNFNIDGLIGTTDTTGTATSSSSSKKVGLLSLENLETSVAMTYKF